MAVLSSSCPPILRSPDNRNLKLVSRTSPESVHTLLDGFPATVDGVHALVPPPPSPPVYACSPRSTCFLRSTKHQHQFMYLHVCANLFFRISFLVLFCFVLSRRPSPSRPSSLNFSSLFVGTMVCLCVGLGCLLRVHLPHRLLFLGRLGGGGRGGG